MQRPSENPLFALRFRVTAEHWLAASQTNTGNRVLLLFGPLQWLPSKSLPAARPCSHTTGEGTDTLRHACTQRSSTCHCPRCHQNEGNSRLPALEDPSCQGKPFILRIPELEKVVLSGHLLQPPHLLSTADDTSRQRQPCSISLCGLTAELPGHLGRTTSLLWDFCKLNTVSHPLGSILYGACCCCCCC